MISNVTDHPYREFERSGWERAAAAYAGSFEAATSLFATPLLDAAQVRRGLAVLDVACGPGSVTSLAAARGAAAIGVDFSPSMIAEARRRHPSLSFQEADAEALPFADHSFDAVIINFGIHHFPFPVRALREAPGGGHGEAFHHAALPAARQARGHSGLHRQRHFRLSGQ